MPVDFKGKKRKEGPIPLGFKAVPTRVTKEDEGDST